MRALSQRGDDESDREEEEDGEDEGVVDLEDVKVLCDWIRGKYQRLCMGQARYASRTTHRCRCMVLRVVCCAQGGCYSRCIRSE